MNSKKVLLAFLVLMILSFGGLPEAWSAQAPSQGLFAEGYALLEAGIAAQALTKFEAGLKADPRNALAQFYVGKIYFDLGETDKAKRHLQASLDVDPASEAAEDAKGLLKKLSGGTAGAKTDGQGQPKANQGASAKNGQPPPSKSIAVLQSPGIFKPGPSFKDCDVCPEMLDLPRGSFMMGGSRRITLARSFAVGKTEVTFAQWDACNAEGGCAHKPYDKGWGRGNQPVVNVNWDDAKQYVTWLSRKTGGSYRLLTEAEWEYAARASTTTAYYWGDSDENVCQYANVNRCGISMTSPVAAKQPNAAGLYDMLGNVAEWVEDCWSDDVSVVPSDGSAVTSGECGQRALRGGSWISNPSSARSASRIWVTTDLRDDNSGFRVAKTN